ncbi:MBL fold metallo-hydrolase [Chloroflexi bacterium CFX6]|nr:MBL fold metallo-hydrolase [Chloroflexi bacterium CFX6]
MLEIVSFTLGPAQTNAYLVADPDTKEAAVIDPAWDGLIILNAAQKRGWRIGHLWYTHAHFDHIGGAAAIADASNPLPLVALHPNDHVLWRAGGGGALFGFDIDPGPEPTIDFVHGMKMKLGSSEFEIRFTPGHTPGHCILYVASAGICFCGDLIFAGGVGRTDFPGGSREQLEQSIRTQVFTLPDDTRLLSGHGPETTVGEEKRENPFVRG